MNDGWWEWWWWPRWADKWMRRWVETWCLNNGYFWERQSHERVRAQTLLEKINLVIKDRRLRWLGHVLRMDDNEKSCTIMIIIIKIITTMFMVLSSWKSHCESSPGSFDECRIAPSGRRPKTKPNDLGCESACTGCQKLHPPSPFIITQPESWYSFYHPTEVRRLSRPSWLVTYRDGLPVHRRWPIWILTGSDVVQLRWSKPTCYH